MAKLWGGRFSKNTNELVDAFNASIDFDKRLYHEDIRGSIAHAGMLAKCGIIPAEDGEKIIAGLKDILADIEAGNFHFDVALEDIHMNVEARLTERIGSAGARLHTARSRNDQVALDMHMYMKREVAEIAELLLKFEEALLTVAKKHEKTLMPGYTHLQRAQPITFGHQLMAYAMMLLRDLGRIADAEKRMNCSPLGSCALAGTTYPTDRRMVADALHMNGIAMNSLDGVSDRDFCVELGAAFAVLMMHLSRFSEEIILWSSWEFKFIELDDSYTTGSSIMPQKKNPDMAELVRGKTGRVYGDLMTLLTMLKGLPLAYNKDMQEDKEAILDAVDTVKMCLRVFAPMVRTMRVCKENMLHAAQRGFINATDLADYLVRKGMPFRSAYKIVGQIVAHCIATNQVLETLPLEEYRKFSPEFDCDLYSDIALETCVAKRISEGGTTPESVEKQIAWVRAQL